MEIDPQDDYEDDDYSELFKTFILNISDDDLVNITSLVNMNETYNTRDNSDSVDVNFTRWLFPLNIIAGVGILTNSVLAFMLIVDLVIDRSRRYFTRHWLLLNSSITHVAFLGVSIYFREFGVSLRQNDKLCLVLQHTDKTIEFVTVLYLILIASNIFGNSVKPSLRCGPRNVLFWIILVLLTMVCANLGILALFTMKLDGLFENATVCQLDATLTLMFARLVTYLLAIVIFYVPYGILLTIAFSTLLCYCIQRNKLTPSSSNVNDFYISRKHLAIFTFIMSTAGFLLMLPYYIFQVPMIAYMMLEGWRFNFFSVFFVCLMFKLIFYAIFPLICLILVEVKQIYRKAITK